MALAHQKMYQDNNFEQINVTEYSRDIMEVLVNSIPKHDLDQFEVLGEDLFINVEQAQAVGFIVHELITNSIKYAWDNDQKRNIEVKYQKDGEQLKVTYKDNGKGLPSGFELETATSLGMKLVNSFVKRQLKGSIDSYADNGVNFAINFNYR
ncbi:MAG: sensor histidine kinase [Flavobacteriales bacterium]|nr:sensor histidine kinase [Flavobacteriales bacterium]